MATGTTHRPQPKLYDLDVTIVSAKHLKNVNWRNGDLKPYVILWVDPDRRQATKPDDSGSTRPVWNERFVLPLSLPLRDSALTLEVFHSKPSETSKPLVGAHRFELRDLLGDSADSAIRLRTFELLRPSGRPHGKIRLKIGLVERPVENYHPAPATGYYNFSAPPPPMPYRGYSPSPYSTLPPPSSFSPPPQPYYSYSDPHSGYYSSYYSPSPAPPPPPPARPFLERPLQSQSSYGGSGASGPSAPVDYTPYDYHKRSLGKPGIGMGTGLAVGAAAGALGGLSLDEGIKYEEEKIAERVENDMVSSTARDDRYGEYRSDY
ncbi:formin-like protein 14 [Salvia miltiorrhiza]|uniref:formin-like protein 14 n=1 Tax=Salvia miltiorrhiza TaxID=226208 RepID=UPI0025AB6B11|nr:formin-like protein 14 [Salvia miltiorrhiza]